MKSAMNPITAFKRLLCLAAIGLLAACAQPAPVVASRTPAPSHTPTATATQTPKPTATPTALPLQVTGDLRAGLLAQPISQPNAPCGVVDLLDFPVGLPDGEGYGGQGSFGIYRDRYNGIHAGEDWGISGGASLGQPVYSIGHGTVTYAQPLGWGIDRGVVIVRHLFPDGSTFLSFYGHLDPPSVVLQPGDCVARGEQVGAIGKPRGRPHLHFEIRTHMPDQPGPGYWPVDPRLAGWLEPSTTIWDYRAQSSPGVAWMHSFTTGFSTAIGLLNDETLAAIVDRQLVGFDARDGSLRWSRPVSRTLSSALLDANGAAIYLANLRGSVEAIDASGASVWQLSLAERGRAVLLPLPGGGIIAYFAEQLIGLSATGARLWEIDFPAFPLTWALSDDQLFFTTGGEQPLLHRINRDGQLEALASIEGRPFVAGDQVYVLARAGVYRLEPETRTIQLIYPLDAGLLRDDNMAALPDGSLLLSHRGWAGQRLIWIDADGVLRWDRSVADLGLLPPRIVVAGEQVYAVAETGQVLNIDLSTGSARRVFDVGGTLRLAGAPWVYATANGRLLFDYRGGGIIALDPRLAVEAVGGAP